MKAFTTRGDGITATKLVERPVPVPGATRFSSG